MIPSPPFTSVDYFLHLQEFKVEDKIRDLSHRLEQLEKLFDAHILSHQALMDKPEVKK